MSGWCPVSRVALGHLGRKFATLVIMDKQTATAQVSMTPDARSDLRRLAFALTGRAARRVDMSAALRAAVSVALADLDRTAALLPNGD
jgi:hypothetical protein